MASGLRALGLPIGPVVTMERSSRGGAREALRRIQGADRVKGQRPNPKLWSSGFRGPESGCALSVVIMCMSSLLIGGEDQRELLLDALEMGMVSDGYVFIPYDALLYAMPHQVTGNTLAHLHRTSCES